MEIWLWLLGSSFFGSLGLQALVTGGLAYGELRKNQQLHWEEEEASLIPDYPIDNLDTNGKVNSSPELTQDWEYKIVRASTDVFREWETLQQLCAEEAQAGWIMLEKLDDRRIRFKRLMSWRETIKPEELSIDPYRSHYGSNWTPLTGLGAIAFMISLILPAYLGYTLVSALMTRHPPQPVLPQEQITP